MEYHNISRYRHGAPQSDGAGVVGEEQYSPNLLQRAARVTFRQGCGVDFV
jgi:hypothetical protein